MYPIFIFILIFSNAKTESNKCILSFVFLDQAPRNEDRRDHPLTNAGWEEQEFMGVIGTLGRD